MSSPQIVLITGGNRGLGAGTVERFLAAENNIVIATARDPTDKGSQVISKLPVGKGSKLIIAKYNANDEQSALNMVKELQQQHGINHLDIVFSNAGISNVFASVKEVKIKDMRAHYDVNVVGSVLIFQATVDLLQKSSRKPIFAFMSSSAGSLARQPPIVNAAYGPTKVVVNWYAVRANAENEWLNVFAVDPGWVQTEMGNAGANVFGMSEAPLTIKESCDGMYKVLTTATKEKHGGQFVEYSGELLPW